MYYSNDMTYDFWYNNWLTNASVAERAQSSIFGWVEAVAQVLLPIWPLWTTQCFGLETAQKLTNLWIQLNSIDMKKQRFLSDANVWDVHSISYSHVSMCTSDGTHNVTLCFLSAWHEVNHHWRGAPTERRTWCCHRDSCGAFPALPGVNMLLF